MVLDACCITKKKEEKNEKSFVRAPFDLVSRWVGR
jgi:hypothetical protein